MTFDNDVTLLTLMCNKINSLFVTVIIKLHIKRKCNTVTELGCKVEAYHIMGLLNALSAASACQSILTKLGALTLKNITEVDTKIKCTMIKEGYG